MRVSLVVLTPGKWNGKSIPVTRSPFLIGRDAECHLRPNSPMISARHCALLVRAGRLFVQDLGSTNGTRINEKLVEKAREVHTGDRLLVGPLALEFQIKGSPSVDEPTPIPPTKGSNFVAEDDAAAVLLALGEETQPTSGSWYMDEERVSPADTVTDLPVSEADKAAANVDPKAQNAAVKAGEGDTSTAAGAILKQYLKKPRR